MGVSQKKTNYVNQFRNYCEEYRKVLIVNADNVGSNQMQQVRKALRGSAVIVMGKNTLMKKAITIHKEQNAKLQAIVPFMKGNIGLVFTNDDLSRVRDILVANKVSAAAKQGAISPVDVMIEPINTGLEPTKTSFFQALNIATKITRGTVEIVNPVHLLKKNDKVGNSEATLLQMLNIKPFSYGLSVLQVYDDGSIYSPQILDITENVLAEKFYQAVNNVAAVSLATGIPTEASIPHSLINGFKNLLSIAVSTQVTFKEAEEVKAFLKDPSKFAVASTSAPAPAAATSSGAKGAAPAAKVEEPEEPEDDDVMGGLFG